MYDIDPVEVLKAEYKCTQKLGSGAYTTAFVSPHDDNIVILFDTSSDAKRVAYESCGMLYKAESKVVSYCWNGQARNRPFNIYHVKRLINDRWIKPIVSKTNWFNRMANQSYNGDYWSSYETRRLEVNGFTISGDLYTLVDIATSPNTPKYLAKFFMAIIDYAIKTKQDVWFDNHRGNWLYDKKTHRCYPLDVINF